MLIYSRIRELSALKGVKFLKQVVRCNAIPFELRADPFYSAENQARLLTAKERMEKTGGTVHELIEADDD